MKERAAAIDELLTTEPTPVPGRVIVVADDCRFLDTVHADGPPLIHEWAVARSREHFVELTEPPPLAVILDLDARSVDAVEILYLLGALSLPAKVVILDNGDAAALANARSVAKTVAADVIGTLTRPLEMGALLRLLGQQVHAAVTISVDELHVALLEQQLILHYQPIIERDGERWLMQSVEALVRWRHPVHGLLYPGQFLGIARAAHLMTELTDFVMTEGAQQAGQWREQGIGLGLTVNLEPRLVRDVGFAERLVRLLRQFDVPPERFTLEVIESASARDRELLADAMNAVRKHGVRLSLDDFGSGNSSLTELHRLPFTDLKIDRSLVHDTVRSPKAATIVTGIIELAHRLAIRVCAEGVETPEAFAFLSGAHCDAIQGVFVARPTTAANIERLVASWQPERIGAAVAQAVGKLSE